MMLEMRLPCYHYIYTAADWDRADTYVQLPVEDINFDKIYDLLVDYLRFLTKFVTFGIMYGRKAPSLANGELNCSVAEAQKYLNNFLARFPMFRDWMKAVAKQALADGYIQTAFGHKRRWAFITRDIAYDIANQAVNTPIQGTAAQICLMALARIHERFKVNGWGWVLFTVHDSIVFEIKKEYLLPAINLIREEMQVQVLDSEVPLTVDVEIGPSYGKVEGVEYEGKKLLPAKAAKASKWLLNLLSNLQQEGG